MIFLFGVNLIKDPKGILNHGDVVGYLLSVVWDCNKEGSISKMDDGVTKDNNVDSEVMSVKEQIVKKSH